MQAGTGESRFKERERSGPQQSVLSPSKLGQSCSLSCLALHTVYPGREPLSSYHTTRSEQQTDFQESWNLLPPHRPRDVCLLQYPAIVGWINTQRARQAKPTDIFQQTSVLKCGYFTSKACIKKNLSIKQWLAQDIQALALPGRPRANCNSQENWVESLADWARMRISMICIDPTHLQTVYNVLSCWRVQCIYLPLKANIPYISYRHLKAEMNGQWTWTLASINLTRHSLSALLNYSPVSWINSCTKASKHNGQELWCKGQSCPSIVRESRDVSQLC